MSKLNNRKNTRVLYKNNAILILPQKEFTDCRTENLSLKGVYLPEITDATAGTEGTIRIVIDRKTKIIINAIVKVARSDSTGTALEFVSMDTESLYHLKKIVMYNSGDPDSVAEEFKQ